MREAFGGIFSVEFLLVFLAILISIVAIIMNYAKAFKVKNQLVDYIEQYQGYTDTANDKIEYYLDHMNYHVRIGNRDQNNASGFSVSSTITDNRNGLSENETYCEDNNYGYCVTKAENNKGSYYIVTVFLSFDFNLFNMHFNVPIRGETRTLMY